MPHTDAGEYSTAFMRWGVREKAPSVPPWWLQLGERALENALWGHLNANVLGRQHGGQRERWWEGAGAQGLEAPLETPPPAVPSPSLGSQP